MLLLDDRHGGACAVHPRLRDRLSARLHADRIDRDLAAGASPDGDVVVALRARHLTSDRTRRALAGGVRRAVREAEDPLASAFSPVPRNRSAIMTARADLEQLRSTLLAGGPVSPRGVALAEDLLTDGQGPLYNHRTRQDLARRVHATIEALDITAQF